MLRNSKILFQKFTPKRSKHTLWSSLIMPSHSVRSTRRWWLEMPTKKLHLISERERERDVFARKGQEVQREREEKTQEAISFDLSCGWMDRVLNIDPIVQSPKEEKSVCNHARGSWKDGQQFHPWSKESIIQLYSSRHIREASFIAEDSQLSNQMPYLALICPQLLFCP